MVFYLGYGYNDGNMSRLKIALLSFVSLLVTVSAVAALQPAPALASPIPTDPDGSGSGSSNQCPTDQPKTCAFVQTYINPFIKLLTAAVGIFATISIVYAGIMYATSADDPSVVTKAKKRIFETILGVVAYVFLFAFINYLIPGGIF